MTQDKISTTITNALDEEFSISPDHMSDHDASRFYEILNDMIASGRTDVDQMIVEIHNWYLPTMPITER